MKKKCAKYLLLFIAVLLFNFLLPRLLPGSPIARLGGEEIGSLSKAEKQQILAAYALDRPWPEQFFRYIKAVFTGDLGISFSKKLPVIRVLTSAAPWTILLCGSSVLLSLALGSGLGAYSVLLRRKKRDMPLLWGMSIIGSFPSFWVGMVLLAVFGVHLGWLPIYGAYTLWQQYTGFQRWADVLTHLILPLITLSCGSLTLFFSTMRASLLLVIEEDYIKMAALRGLSTIQIYFFYALRNAMIPTFTVLMLDLGQLLGGAVVIEAVFSYPGLGRVLYEAVLSRDYPLMQYSFLLIAVMVLAACLITEALHPVLDPRVTRHEC